MGKVYENIKDILNNSKFKIKLFKKEFKVYVFEDSLTKIFRVISEAEIIINTKLLFIFTEGKIPIIFDYNLKELSAYQS